MQATIYKYGEVGRGPLLTVWLHNITFQKGLTQLDFSSYVPNQSLFLEIKDVASHALLQKFQKIQILVVEGFKLSACLSLGNVRENICVKSHRKGVIVRS